ncbi:MAG: tRNA pseudouridine(55) synthase TruB [Verrucomicrobiales bacterium]|jgi:tRNA pseudouridine55 synthase|nr:tRNA pseudouridine(55) synthase TruB [Verrucomicrobiales bacterium]
MMLTGTPQQPDGLLLVDKPANCTSHDVVDYVRRRFKFKKVGHCGTLDPMATGLLMLVLGRATKVQDLLMSEDKEYAGTLKLGAATSTQDAEGEVTETRPVPPLTEQALRAAFDKFKGDFYQTPPMVSALKKDGVPLYKLARQGKVVEREPRLVHVYSYQLTNIAPPAVDFVIRCSKGFYVRTYCHDLGQELGCGGHLAALRRTRSGNFTLEHAVTRAELEATVSAADLLPRILGLTDISRIRRQ